MEKNLIDIIAKSGIVGAGGAGFPTHVKMNAKAEYVIINGAECEPLLRVDQQLMAVETKKILDALKLCIGSSGPFILLPFWRTFSLAGVNTALGGSSTSTPELSPLWLWMLESFLVFRHLATSVTSGGGEISTKCSVPCWFPVVRVWAISCPTLPLRLLMPG